MTATAVTDRIDAQTAVVAISGPLRLSAELSAINTGLQQLVSDGITRIVLDLGDCPYVDSAGLGTLIHTGGLLAERNGALRLCATNERIGALLQMTRTDALLPRDATRQAALAAFG